MAKAFGTSFDEFLKMTPRQAFKFLEINYIEDHNDWQSQAALHGHKPKFKKYHDQSETPVADPDLRKKILAAASRRNFEKAVNDGQ